MAKKSSDSITQVVKSADPMDTDRLSLLKSRLAVAKAWAKKPHKAWKKWIKEYDIEDIDDTAEIRDKVRIGYIFRHVESDMPAVFDQQPEIFIKGKGKNKILDPLIDGTYDWLWDVQNLEEVLEDAATYFLLLGLAGVDSPWLTKTEKVPQIEQVPLTDEAGQVVLDPMTGQPQMTQQEVVYDVPVINRPDAETVNLFKVYFSPETKFGPVLTYKKCPYYFREHVMTEDEVKARFGKDVEAQETLKIYDDEDSNEEIEKFDKDVQKDDMKRVTVYEYYGCLPRGQEKGIGGEWAYDKDYHIWMTKNEELLAEECPYDNKPLHLIGNYGLANRFWKFGDAKHLMPLVQELQMLRSQNLKHTRKMANPKALIPEDAQVDEKLFRDPREGVIVKYKPGLNGAKPEYMQPPQLGREVETGIQEVRQDLEKTSGSFDLASGGGQSSVKSPRGIQVFSEAADKNVRRKRKKIARLIRQLIIFQFEQLATNWTPDGTESIDVIVDGDQQKLPVVKEVLQVLGDPNILSKLDIEIESLSINRVQMKQDALDLLDTALKSEATVPGMLNLEEIWKDVLQNAFNKRDADRYMNPPEVRQKMLEQQAQAQQQQPKGPSESISFKDLPPTGKIQMAAKAGIQLTPEGLAQMDALSTHQQAAGQVDQIPQGGVQNG